MQLFYQNDIPPYGSFIMEEQEAKHCLQVLRYQVGDQVQLTDGKGHLFTTHIEKIQSKKCFLKIIEKQFFPKNEPYFIHLAIAPTKNADRMEWLVEKCVEIGIDEISFVQTKHTERKHFSLDRIEKKAVAALKQSLKFSLPVLNPLQDFEDFVKKNTAQQKFIAYVDQQNPETLFQKALASQYYTILIGPEGDFSEQELACAFEYNFQKVSLGNSRLRTETAALVALMTLHLKN